MKKIKDLQGQKYNLLTVVEKTTKRSGGSVVWKCICYCGNETEASSGNLRSGHTKSCGCHKSKTSSNTLTSLATKHGHGKTGKVSRTYSTWLHIQDRCNNPKNDSYQNYGGRGITVCDRWREFSNFLEDMGERPKGTSIDRINVDLGYCKTNCRWATDKVQHNNKRGNRKYTYKGETLTISQLSEKYGIDRAKLSYRLKSGWDIEQALNRK